MLPDGGGYIWPLMKATLLMLTAERLEVMMGCPPRFVIPAPDTMDDVYRTFATLTDDRVLKLPMGDVIGAIPVLVSPPFTKTVEAYMVEGVAPVIPDWGGYDWPLMNDTKRSREVMVLTLPVLALMLVMLARGDVMFAVAWTRLPARIPPLVTLPLNEAVLLPVSGPPSCNEPAMSAFPLFLKSFLATR